LLYYFLAFYSFVFAKCHPNLYNPNPYFTPSISSHSIDPYQRLILDIVLQTVTEDIERTIRLDKENKRFSEKIKELKTGLDKEESKRRAFEMLYEKKKSELIVARGIMKTIEQAILSVGIEEPRMGE
jgi:hypothetical protein